MNAPLRSNSRALHIVGWFIVALLTSLLTVSATGAQEDIEQLDELKDERERLQIEIAESAVEVDAANASFQEVAAALDDVNTLVDLQEARLADAVREVASAEALAAAAELRETEIAAEIAEIGRDLADLAIASFTGEDGANGHDLTVLLLSGNPSEAARRRSLIQFQTGSLADGIDRMRALSAEAEVVSEQRQVAAEAAEAGRAEATDRLRKLDEAKAAQADLVVQAEARLEARLSEAAFMAERDAEAAAEISRQEEQIADRLRLEDLAANPRPQVPLPSDIVTVQGIPVHQSIAVDLDRLLDAARADGINLGGWGYRSSDKQIALRQQHCGTSDQAIWDMPASACSPPTARPGQSMHERGLAVDFTYNGGSMTSRSNVGFQWLAEHAGAFGFVNLPSEPWHWSNDG